MNDTQFDDFFNDKLKDLAAPVPAGLWEKVSEGQFDQFVGGKLKDHEAPVPNDLWDKVTDAQFDNFVGDKLFGNEAVIASPDGLWNKINDGQFDHFVAGKLIAHESPVPAGLWEKVRPKEDDDRTGFIWFRYPVAALLVLSFLAAGAIGGYIFYNAQKKTAAGLTETNSSNTKNTGAGKTGTQETPKATDQLNSVIPPAAGSANTDPSAANQSKSNLPADAAASKQAVSNSTNHSHADALTDPSATANALNEHAATDRSSSSTNQSAFISKANKKGFSLRPPAGNNNDVTNNSYDIFKNNNGATVTADKGSDRSSGDENDLDYMQPYQHNVLTGFTIPSLNGKSGLSQHALDMLLSTANHTNQYRNIVICPTGKSGNADWFVEAYASPDIALKSISNISASQQYLLRKDSSESMQLSYSAGVRLVKPITDNILLKAGIQYSQVNQKYVYRVENEVKTTTVVTERTIIRAPGDTVIVKDTSTLQTVGFRNNTVNNHYRSFDIPVTVGYQFGNEDLKFGINAGVVLNLSSWYEGVILDSSLATVTLNKTGNNIYKSNIGLGLYGSFSVVKRLSEDMHIFLEPYFRYNLSNMTTPQSTYNQKFSLGGLAIGLRFNLNRK
jgi:hypothetical protein